MTMTHSRCSSVSSAVTKRQALAADSSGSENNQAGKLNAGASKKRPGLYHVARRIKLSPFSFYKLKSLKLEVVIYEESMQMMMLLLKYSPNLEVLKLWSDESVDESVDWQLLDLDESIVCLESHLKSIHLTGFKGEENEIELLKFFLKNARVLEKLMIFWEINMDKSQEASEEVLNFHRTSSHVVLTFLDAKPKQRSHNWYNRYSK